MLHRIAFGAGATVLCMLVNQTRAALFGCRIHGIQNIKDPWLNYVIVHVEAITPNFDQSGFPQDHQLLGDPSLPQTKHRFHVANALLSIPQDFEDGQAGGMGDDFEKIGLQAVCFHGDSQYSEF